MSEPTDPGAQHPEPTEQERLDILRHSTAHVMAQGVLSLWPEAHYAIGPPIEDGFYYDFDIGRPFTPEDLAAVERAMRGIIAQDQPFVREEVPLAAALEVFKDQPYKVEILHGIGESSDQGVEGETVSLYRNPHRGKDGGSYLDLCRGPHVSSTGQIPAFKLLRSSGAYWRGDEHRPMLQRIYGTAWFTQKELDDYLHRLEEAQRRDHRRLGTELDLFSFPAELGAGLAVWHPKGALVRRIMEEYSRQVHERSGYQFAYTPHLARSTLWETSGHLHWYAEGMYPPMQLEEAQYYVKPMSCPFHILIYKSRMRSYRELPLRLFEFGTCYRYERTGVLHGFMRIRGFTQDDSHIFLPEDQVVGELRSLLGFVVRMLRDFGFDTFSAKLSTRDPDKSVGTEAGWELATEALRQALVDEGIPYIVNERDAAFYGPKIDIEIRDAIGRAWQLSTLQVDFNNPELFDMTYVSADNERVRPWMIHRALFGSIERFFGILVEHYAGAFPVWLAPVQAVVIPIADRHEPYAATVADQLRAAGLRVEVDASGETLGNRVRKAQGEKVPYMLVVGDREAGSGSVAVRARSGEKTDGVPLARFIAQLSDEARPGTRPGAPAAPGGQPAA
ncbi:MAG TPA: threonine--tRNA ligase [Actinomycetota bacterium]|nr:threonine--tRNA ligase [Actinomycetota bacterium]